MRQARRSGSQAAKHQPDPPWPRRATLPAAPGGVEEDR
jgi:hypothetical protein